MGRSSSLKGRERDLGPSACAHSSKTILLLASAPDRLPVREKQVASVYGTCVDPNSSACKEGAIGVPRTSALLTASPLRPPGSCPLSWPGIAHRLLSRRAAPGSTRLVSLIELYPPLRRPVEEGSTDQAGQVIHVGRPPQGGDFLFLRSPYEVQGQTYKT